MRMAIQKGSIYCGRHAASTSRVADAMFVPPHRTGCSNGCGRRRCGRRCDSAPTHYLPWPPGDSTIPESYALRRTIQVAVPFRNILVEISIAVQCGNQRLKA